MFGRLAEKDLLCKLKYTTHPLLTTDSPPFPPCLPALDPVDPLCAYGGISPFSGGVVCGVWDEATRCFPVPGSMFRGKPRCPVLGETPRFSVSCNTYRPPPFSPSPIVTESHMKTPCSAGLILAGFLAPACNGFVPGTALSPQQQRSTSATPTMIMMSSSLRSRIGHAVAVAVASSVVALGVTSVPVAVAEELPAGESCCCLLLDFVIMFRSSSSCCS